MSARDDIHRLFESGRTSYRLDEYLDAHRAERDAEIMRWLGKKAREYRATGRKADRERADLITMLASKISRGAVRPDNTRLPAGVISGPQAGEDVNEQIEDEFWAQERARAVAERGRQADPSACGTCRAAVEAGGQVVHDECAQRATLLPAPDAPGYELVTGMSEEEVRALPARFHIPVFMESSTPKLWVCAVCWGDGWSTQWPCKTAVEHGLRVFIADDYAETAAKRQAARIAELEAQLAEMTRLRDNALRALNRDDVETDIDLEETIAAPFYGPGWDWDEADLQRVVREAAAAVRPAFGKLTQERDQARAELAKYVGREPTVAEEMAYLSRCLDAVYQLCAEAKRSGSLGITPEAVEQAADGEWTADSPRAALPWAHAMSDEDLHGFLDDLVSAAMARWRSEPDIPDRQVLADVEKACADWRTPGQGYRSDEPGADR